MSLQGERYGRAGARPMHEDVGSDQPAQGAFVGVRRPPGASDAVPVRAGALDRGLAGSSIVDPAWQLGDALPPVAGARHPRWTNERARRRASVTTFGPVGRVVCTLVLVGVPAVLCLLSPLNVLLCIPYVFVLVPALRDVWQAAPVETPVPPAPARDPLRVQPEGSSSLWPE